MALRSCRRLVGGFPCLYRSGCISPPVVLGPSGRSFVRDLARTPASSSTLLLRKLSSAPPSTDVNYVQMKKLLAAGTSVVIDVREPWELREYGFIPTSINVPLGQVNAALQMDPEEFKEKFGGEMPQQTDNIVFTCLAGIRSKTALDTATSLGYKDVQHYIGGWTDWVKNGGGA